MKYDESVCKFNMDTGCVELLLRDGSKISIDCTGVEDALGRGRSWIISSTMTRLAIDYIGLYAIGLSSNVFRLTEVV